MLLTIDIGNTNILAGIFKGDEIITHWRIYTNLNKTDSEYTIDFDNMFRLKGIKINSIKEAIISSVVPPLTSVYKNFLEKEFKIKTIVLDSDLEIGVKILYENPKEVGSDRIANAVGAIALYGKPIIVVDFGTATTFDVVSKEGDYLGGLISSGIEISADALFRRTAKLPRISIQKPKNVVAKTTVESIQAGLYYGYVGQVDYIIEKIWEELDYKTKVVATGGLANMISEDSKYISTVNSFLTLYGLYFIYKKIKAVK